MREKEAEKVWNFLFLSLFFFFLTFFTFFILSLLFFMLYSLILYFSCRNLTHFLFLFPLPLSCLVATWFLCGQADPRESINHSFRVFLSILQHCLWYWEAKYFCMNHDTSFFFFSHPKYIFTKFFCIFLTSKTKITENFCLWLETILVILYRIWRERISLKGKLKWRQQKPLN